MTNERPEPRSLDARDLSAGLAVAAAIGLLYLAAPVRPLLDSRYAVLTSESLLVRRSWDLSPSLPMWTCPETSAEALRAARAWQLQCVGSRLIYRYPPGTAVLSLPAVALLRVAGLSSLRADGRYRAANEGRMQAWIAAAVTAGTVLLIFFAARRELGRAGAAAVGAATGLGTGLLSFASRALWTHCWGALLWAAVLVELLRWEEGRTRRPVLLGALLSAAFCVRPANAAMILATTLLVAWVHRPALKRLLATGVVGMIAFAAWAIPVAGSLMPRMTYRTAADLSLAHAGAGLRCLLFSPLVGLFVFTPALLVIVTVLLRGPIPANRRALVLWTAAVGVGALATYSPWVATWGGGPLGPRFFTEMSTLFGWLGAVAWNATAARGWTATALATRVVMIALVVAGVAAHAAIATPVAGKWSPARRELSMLTFSGRPPEILWDWSETPYGALWRSWRPGASADAAEVAPPRRPETEGDE